VRLHPDFTLDCNEGVQPRFNGNFELQRCPTQRKVLGAARCRPGELKGPFLAPLSIGSQGDWLWSVNFHPATTWVGSYWNFENSSNAGTDPPELSVDKICSKALRGWLITPTLVPHLGQATGAPGTVSAAPHLSLARVPGTAKGRLTAKLIARLDRNSWDYKAVQEGLGGSCTTPPFYNSYQKLIVFWILEQHPYSEYCKLFEFHLWKMFLMFLAYLIEL